MKIHFLELWYPETTKQYLGDALISRLA